MKKVAAAILDSNLQKNAREFIQGRTDFRGYSVSGGVQRKSGDNYFGWYNNYKANKIGSVPNFNATATTSSGPGPSIELGKGYGSEGSKIAGELGRFMKKRGVVPGSIHRHPEHPPYSLTSGHSRGSLHYQGRAIDLGANANEQGPILAALAEFNRLKGVKPVQLLHAGNDRSGSHNDHVHVAYHRGKVRSGREMIARILKDEKVFDSDTSKAFDKIDPLLAYRLNKASTTSEVMNVLRSYAGYEQPYVEFEIIEVPVPVEVPVPMGDYQSSGGGVALIPFGGGDDPFETLYKGG
jgi:hypothetical protein